jgi:hypothetical protein
LKIPYPNTPSGNPLPRRGFIPKFSLRMTILPEGLRMLTAKSALSGLTCYESDTTVGVTRPDVENERKTYNKSKKVTLSFSIVSTKCKKA